MTKLRTLVLASAFGLATVTATSAAVVIPQIPNPANPHPAYPIATDGSPLPPMGWAEERMDNGMMDEGLMDDGYSDADLY